jgi:phosphoglycerate kinase
VKRTLESLNPSALEGRRALVRVDFNCPIKDGVVTDDTRIRASLPTIKYLRDKGARVVLVVSSGTAQRQARSRIFARALRARAGEAPRGTGHFPCRPSRADAVTASKRLPRGGVAVAENTRFYPGEEKNDRSWQGSLPPSAISM